MRDNQKHWRHTAACVLAVCLLVAGADAATLGSGKGWQAPWETVTSGGLTLSVNATGGAVTQDGRRVGAGFAGHLVHFPRGPLRP